MTKLPRLLSESRSGEGWEYRKGYLDSGVAQRTAEQAKMLFTIAAQPCFRRRNQTSYLQGMWAMSVLDLYIKEPAVASSRTVNNYPAVVSEASLIIELFEKTSRETSDTQGIVSLLYYGAFGRIKKHRDHPNQVRADNTLALTLEGVALTTLDDSKMGTVRVAVQPGDGIFFDNTIPPEERVTHTVQNLSTKPRIAYVD